MNALLICPHQRPSVALLGHREPLALLPVCGKRLIEYWIERLADRGARAVKVLASDRPEQIRAVVGDGRRWGLRVEVIPESHELSIDEAREKYCSDSRPWLSAPEDVQAMDCLPNGSAALFAGFRSCFEQILEFSARAATPTRIGLREIQPGVWSGLRARIDSKARLRPPCWIGDNVRIGPRTVIGPNAVIDNRCFIERGVEITDSVIGPETFVGAYTEIDDSLALGNALINWKTNSHVFVPDPFLLNSITGARLRIDVPVLLGRLAAATAMILTSPLALYVCIKCAFRGQQPLRELVAVRPVMRLDGISLEKFPYYEFTNMNRWVRRWPQLWSIVNGDFCWVGNRPMSPSRAERMTDDFERLWLHAPVGLVSLADVRGWMDSFSDEARAHASFYAVQRGWGLDGQILCRAPVVMALSAQKLWENNLVPLPVRQWLRTEYPTFTGNETH
ncbi:MAG: sugar transferase [Verrucomicrobia subdivision 3 bacterium]|nr:sugar transferase [Limisphaerales bacterium]